MQVIDALLESAKESKWIKIQMLCSQM
jgi:hypothetical protein